MIAAMEGDTSDREIRVERLVKAPRELVWEVWTKPEHVAQWWGPEGWHITTRSMDIRVGGMWDYVMHGPGNVNMNNYTRYHEVTPPARLVYEHGENIGEPPWFHVTVDMEEADGKTLVKMRLVFPTKEARDEVVEKYGAIEGGKQTLAKLDDYLQQMQSQGELV